MHAHSAHAMGASKVAVMCDKHENTTSQKFFEPMHYCGRTTHLHLQMLHSMNQAGSLQARFDVAPVLLIPRLPISLSLSLLLSYLRQSAVAVYKTK